MRLEYNSLRLVAGFTLLICEVGTNKISTHPAAMLIKMYVNHLLPKMFAADRSVHG